MAEEVNTNVTFEKIYEILRNEKKKDELNKLDPNFFADVSCYVKEKKEAAMKMDTLALQQMSTIKRMITEIFERRESKIIKLATHSARLKSKFIDKSKLLDFELEYFYKVNEVLQNAREDILEKALSANYTHRVEIDVKIDEETKEKVTEQGEIDLQEEEDNSKDLKSDDESINSSDTVKVRFLADVSKFVGEDMEIFGPYEKDSTANLPQKIADILVNRKQAEIVE